MKKYVLAPALQFSRVFAFALLAVLSACGGGAAGPIGSVALIGVAPANGSTTGATVVTLTGSNLSDAIEVTFDGRAGTNLRVNSATQIMVTTPPGTSGVKDILVRSTFGTARLLGSYTYVTAGQISTIAGTDFGVGLLGDGGAAKDSQLGAPTDIALDSAGNLYVSAFVPDRIRVVARTAGTYFGVSMTPGSVYSIAGTTPGFSGDGGPAVAAQIATPHGLAFDSAGNLYIADNGTGRIRVIANSAGTNFGVMMLPGNIYTVAGTVAGTSTGDGAAATSAQLSGSFGLAFDSVGNLYIGDKANSRVRVVAHATGTYFGVSMTAGNIYTVAGTSYGMSGDEGPAIAAQFREVGGVAFDADGNLYISDIGNGRIRVVAKSNGTFFGVPMVGGSIYTVAGTSLGFSGDGSAALAAQLSPISVRFDATGNMYIGDTGNHRIRAVAKVAGTHFGVAMTPNNIYTVAGTTSGFSGDDGQAVLAQLFMPFGIAFDAAGAAYIADGSNGRIRAVTP